jgi:hypothetical protein
LFGRSTSGKDGILSASLLDPEDTPMTDTRPFDPALFHDAAIDPDTANLNAQMIELLTGQPEWWIVGAQAARAARQRGEGPFPAPVFSDRARTMTITGKHGNQIPCA